MVTRRHTRQVDEGLDHIHMVGIHVDGKEMKRSLWLLFFFLHGIG